jgi:hypothetical protein
MDACRNGDFFAEVSCQFDDTYLFVFSCYFFDSFDRIVTTAIIDKNEFE